MSVILLLAVLVGFARTLYLRAFLGGPELPLHLHVHGAVLSAWFLLLVTQTFLVRTGRTAVHRRLGIFGAVLAVAVVAVSLLTLVRWVAPTIDEAPFQGLGNVASLVAFSTCVGAGVLLRRRPDAHNRLMLLGSIVITGPALDRVAQIPTLAGWLDPVLPDALGSTGVAFALFASLSLIFAVVGYDLVTRGRVHAATLGGILAFFILAFAVSLALISSGAWSAFVRLAS